jgi:hypothetical protein
VRTALKIVLVVVGLLFCLPFRTVQHERFRLKRRLQNNRKPGPPPQPKPKRRTVGDKKQNDLL